MRNQTGVEPVGEGPLVILCIYIAILIAMCAGPVLAIGQIAGVIS